MKRGTPTHPKTMDLAEKLGLELWGAIGVLESLWHFAAQHARRGDIGRHSDTAIARAIGWRGDPRLLVDALIECHWLDLCCDTHRLRVHDWPDHADQAVQKTQEIIKLGFLPCYRPPSDIHPSSSGLPEAFRKDSGGPTAEVHPPPVTAQVNGNGRGTGFGRKGGRGGKDRAPAIAPRGLRDAMEAATDSAPGVGAVIPGPPPPVETALGRRIQPPNPLVNAAALVREGHALIREIATAEDLDPTEVLRRASDWNGRGYVRLDAIPEDRLAQTLHQLRDWARRLRKMPAPAAEVDQARADELARRFVAAGSPTSELGGRKVSGLMRWLTDEIGDEDAQRMGGAVSVAVRALERAARRPPPAPPPGPEAA